MSEALVRRYYTAFDAGDWAGMLECLTEDVVHDINQGRREHGVEAFRAFLVRMERSYRERVEDLVVMATPDGHRAAAEFTIRGTYLAADDGLPRAEGQSYVLPVGAFFAIRDGKISRVTNYYNLENWLAQVRIPLRE
ncbi:isopropylmalate/homocitrate/citramalate synthase [Roseococcus sp. SYP-B2431]|uniref:ketosteroid isomerase-related protein n=1 Tax=Roseococcus sp. SYP-B2431 TaxID=2496640 RepID=UPI00103CB986|nr:ketosteroid isomerase-related protein [Roseococcus sp. SYP-B2431]TCH97848.1 isopropylmalate/homocitrate/citramalate synthase [Roseococcus sp. SYP-B2431]